MTDDLVETLRIPNGILDWEYRLKCADRIEVLETALREIYHLPPEQGPVPGAILNIIDRMLYGQVMKGK